MPVYYRIIMQLKRKKYGLVNITLGGGTLKKIVFYQFVRFQKVSCMLIAVFINEYNNVY